MESLKKAKPDIDVTVLGEQFQHAFVLDNPEEMADILAQEIKIERAKEDALSVIQIKDWYNKSKYRCTLVDSNLVLEDQKQVEMMKLLEVMYYSP
ncbi:hypothetical protein J6590_042289 [Homalodisca vitripennis]|nr:hypothetical protein J6590_042289 [Homalodisca vitripennis]